MLSGVRDEGANKSHDVLHSCFPGKEEQLSPRMSEQLATAVTTQLSGRNEMGRTEAKLCFFELN